MEKAQALLRADRLEPGSVSPQSPPRKAGEVLIADTKYGHDGSTKTVNIQSSAYDRERDTYVYSVTLVDINDQTFTLVDEDDLQVPGVEPGQEIKIEIPDAEVVLTVKIKERKVEEGEYRYEYIYEKPTKYYLTEEEVRKLMTKSPAAGERERRLLGLA